MLPVDSFSVLNLMDMDGVLFVKRKSPAYPPSPGEAIRRRLDLGNMHRERSCTTCRPAPWGVGSHACMLAAHDT